MLVAALLTIVARWCGCPVCLLAGLAPLAHEAYVRLRATSRPDLPVVIDIPYNGDDHYNMTLVEPELTRFNKPNTFHPTREQVI